MTDLTWQSIASRDPFLAGSIACREWAWWDGSTAESTADGVGLSGEPREKFLAGWRAEIVEQEQERKERLVREYDQLGEMAFKKGDPAAW